MSRHVTSVEPDTPLPDIAARMLQGPFGGLPVVDAEGTVVGFVSANDVVGALLRGDKVTTPARALMTSPAFVLDEFATTDDVMRLFREEGIHHAPVLRAGRLVGVVSSKDVLRHFVENELDDEDEGA